MGNGVTVMSMIFLSSALISLADKDEEDMFGLKPSSLITAIGTISGILSAIMLPFMGAIVDSTPHRRKIGVIFTIILLAIQTIQIGTIGPTWRYMALLQAINGFVFQVTILATYSYLPEMGREIGEKRMTKYSSKFFMMMFATESIYLIFVIGISIHFGMNDIATSQLAQTMNVAFAGWCYYYGWMFLTDKSGRRKMEDTSSLYISGFLQVFKTASGIWKHYKSSLGWYLFAVVFAEAGEPKIILSSFFIIDFHLKYNFLTNP
jgi:MFS-type transporter involved in bile tolerance (Atg22 family)